MADVQRTLGIDAPRLERLIKQHFGPEFTCRLAWSMLRNRYLASETPRRLAAPQRILGLPVWWRAVGEFSHNLGFRLELWDAAYRRQAEAVVASYNVDSSGPPLALNPAGMPHPVSGRPAGC
jgi:hypothetical protein